MKILFISGTHPRHTFIANALASTGYLTALILEEREATIPSPPPRPQY